MRAVNRDMIALHDRVLEFEGRHASEAELLLFHSPEYLQRVREWSEAAAAEGKPVEIQPGIVVSDASWDAARAASGAVLSAIDSVLEGRAANAFCPVRPPGSRVLPDAAGGFGLLNSVAVAARYLRSRHNIDSIAIVEWSAAPDSVLASIMKHDLGVHVGSVGHAAVEAGGGGDSNRRLLGVGPSGGDFCTAVNEVVEELEAVMSPGVILLAAGMDVLEDQGSGPGVAPPDVYDATRALLDWAEDTCGGRLVSVLEGGYDTSSLGAGVVQHLRALAGLERAP